MYFICWFVCDIWWCLFRCRFQDNSRKLYEYQENEKNKHIINKLEIVANIKMIKVLNHSNIAKESRLKLYVAPEDNRTYDEIMRSGIIEI